MPSALLVILLALFSQVGRYGESSAEQPPTTEQPAASAAAAPTAPADQASTASAASEPSADTAPAASAATGQTQLTINPDPAVQNEPPAAAPPAAAESKQPMAEAPRATPPAAARPLQSAPPAQSSLLAANGPRPSETVRTLLNAPAASKLVGSPVTLGEAVREARTRQDQTARAKAYWELSGAVGDYYLAVIELQQLAALKQTVAAPGAAWDAKLRDAAGRVELAQRAAEAAQLRLQQHIGIAADGRLPLPADFPHCGRYNTEYEEIFAGRPNTAARQLADLMPLRFEQLRTQARAIADAHQWLNQVSQQRDTTTDGSGLIQAYDLLSLRRRAFLATACDYNKEIAAYTELAAPAEVAPDRLVAMMIRTSTTTGEAPWQRDRVEQASANQDVAPTTDLATAASAPAEPPASNPFNPSATARSQGPRTFREFRPLQRLLNRERSIVVERLLERRHHDDNDGQ